MKIKSLWKKNSKEKIFCGLDLGSQSIKVALMKLTERRNIVLLGMLGQKTQGFRDSSVTDLAELSECIHRTIDELAAKVNVKVRDLHLGIGSDMVESRSVNAVIPLVDKGRKVITRSDVKKLNQQARLLGIKMDEEILHDVPQSYLIDDENESKNPLGLYGRKIAVQSLMMITKSNPIRNMIQAVHQAGYDVTGYSLSSYAASQMTLTDDERRQGSVLIDLGSQVTSILIFSDGILKFYDKIDIGGNHLTRKISQEMNVSFDSTEDIKRHFASAMVLDHLKDEEILFKREDGYIPVRRSAIHQVVEPEIQKLLEEITARVTQPGKVSRGIVIIGGGALLPGMIERIGEQTGLSVRLGSIPMSYQTPIKSPAICASAAGLAYLDLKNHLASSFSSQAQGSRVEGITQKIKELYHEYF